MTITVNGGAPLIVTQPGTIQNNGTVSYVGEQMAPDGSWKATWSYSADLDPNGDALVNGSFTLENLSAPAVHFLYDMDLSLCPYVAGDTLLGGVAMVSLEMDEDGGNLSCAPGEAVWAATADDDSAAMMFIGPFSLGGSGAGSMTTNSSFGAPFPSQPGPPVEESFGVRHCFTLTGGDTVKLTTIYKLGGDASDFTVCAPDAPSGPVHGSKKPKGIVRITPRTHSGFEGGDGSSGLGGGGGGGGDRDHSAGGSLGAGNGFEAGSGNALDSGNRRNTAGATSKPKPKVKVKVKSKSPIAPSKRADRKGR
jgi:hypothetical protein